MNSNLGSLLFGFQGRINRAKYWLAAVIYLAFIVVVTVLAFLVDLDGLFIALAMVIYVALLISSIAVGIKRLHDRNKSGWWLLVFYLLPAVLSGIDTATGMTIFSLASAAVSIWMIVELGFLRGTPGPNQYGPDPLAAP